MALWRPGRDGHPAGPGLVYHSDAGSQHTSFVFTAHLIEAGVDASIGTVGAVRSWLPGRDQGGARPRWAEWWRGRFARPAR